MTPTNLNKNNLNAHLKYQPSLPAIQNKTYTMSTRPQNPTAGDDSKDTITSLHSATEKIKANFSTLGENNLNESISEIDKKPQQLGTALRVEIAETHKPHREKMEKKHAMERQQSRCEALFQWVIVTTLIIGAMIKELYPQH